MEDLLPSDSLSIQQLNRGDVVEGTILTVTPREALVDIGAKAEGIIPQRELKGYALSPGDEIFAYVLTTEDRRGQTLLSLRRAESVKAWLDLEKALSEGSTVTATITGHNKGGLAVDVLGLEGFVPFSHADSAPDLQQERAELQSQLDKMRGEEIEVRVIELDREQNRIILSETEALAKEEFEKQRGVLEGLAEGDAITTLVSAVLPYGIMVDVHGVDGLVPQEELSWEDEAPEEILAEFEVGQEVTAKITELEPKAGRLRLSLKQVTQDPWQRLAEEHQEGDEIEGEVSRLTSYGLFVTVGEDVEGMIALSKLPEEQELGVGDTITVVIRKLDVPAHQLELGLAKS